SALSKEYVEAHAGGRSAVLDDFRSLRLMSGHKVERKSSGKQDKGHRAQLSQLREVLEEGIPMSAPDPLDSMDVTLEAVEAARRTRLAALTFVTCCLDSSMPGS